MRSYSTHKRFIPYVEKIIDTDKLVVQLCDYMVLKSLGATDEIANKIVDIDMTYVYNRLMDGYMMLSTKETFFRLKRVKYFKQQGDKLTFSSPMLLNSQTPLIEKIDLNRVIQGDLLDDNSIILKEENDAINDIIQVIESMEKIYESVAIQKLQLDEKKLRAMKDVLTNFRLLLKKIGFMEEKHGNVATLRKGDIVITINSDGLTTNAELFTIQSTQCEIKLL